MTKKELIKYTIAETNKIKVLSLTTLRTRHDYSKPDTKYPQTEAEEYIDDLLHIYLTEDWLEPETEPLLDEISSVLGELDRDVNNEMAWQHLFQLVGELSE